MAKKWLRLGYEEDFKPLDSKVRIICNYANSEGKR